MLHFVNYTRSQAPVDLNKVSMNTADIVNRSTGRVRQHGNIRPCPPDKAPPTHPASETPVLAIHRALL